MNITLRKFELADVPLKVRWINDPRNNRYLHYDLPLKEDATAAWFEKVRHMDNRLDMTILCDSVPIGIAGLLGIDSKNRNAELYITIGEQDYKGRGIAREAIKLLLRIAFTQLQLHRIYLLTEVDNLAAIRAYDKFGFVREGCMRDELCGSDGNYVSLYVYSMLKKEFETSYGSDTGITDSLPGAESE